jgi:dTDP-glucose pyrophosphorylase
MQRTCAIVTMAGLGQRFRDAGYQCPKYQITVRGRPLFAWSMESLRQFIEASAHFVFVTLARDGAGAFIEEHAALLGIRRYDTVELESLTDGQATSALVALDAVPDHAGPVFVYNIDTHVNPAFLPASAVRGDGWIPCFPGEGSGWSFARADESGRVSEVREKQRISAHATLGLYWFSSSSLYRLAYERLYRDDRPAEAGERYIAPMYNELIALGHPVYIHEVRASAVVPLGTPREVDSFIKATATTPDG